MTDFVHVETNGVSGTAFSTWWGGTVPATVPAGDRYIFELQTEDLNESPIMTGKQIDGTIIVRAVTAEIHTGTRGTGRAVKRSSGGSFNVWDFDCTGTGQFIVEDLETSFSDAHIQNNGIFELANTNTPDLIVRRMLITNNSPGATRPFTFLGGMNTYFTSSRYWDESGGNARMCNGFSTVPGSYEWVVQGVTIIGDGTTQRGVDFSDGAGVDAGFVMDIQGNIVLDTNADYNSTNVNGATRIEVQNVSGDLTGQVTGATIVNDLVSLNNPDVKTGSIALQVWTNKPTTFGAEIDIYGNDRTAVAVDAEWDAGSMQFSTQTSPTSTTLRRATGSFATGTGAVGSTIFVPIPFEAKAIKFGYSGIRTATDGVTDNPVNIGMGVASIDTALVPAITQGAMASTWDDNTIGATAFRRVNRVNCVVRVNDTGSNSGALALQSTAVNGMTFVVTEIFPFTVQIMFEALGGSAIEANGVVEFDHQGSTGVQSVGGLNFQPNYGLLAHAFLNIGAGDNALQPNGTVGIGVADGVNSWAMSAIMSGGPDPTDTFKYFHTDQWLATIDAAGAVANRSIWSAWNADGFDIDHVVASGATLTIIGLMLKVSTVEIGTLLTKTDGTDIVTPAGFDSKASFFASCGGAEDTLDVSSAEAQLIFGFSTSPSEQITQGAASKDNVATSIVPVAQDNAAVFIKTEGAYTLAALMSFIATSITNFTTVMDTPEPTAASIVGYALFGDDDPPDEQVDPIGSALSALADTEDVDERHPLAFLLDPTDGSTLQLLSSGFPVIQGTEQGITVDVLSDPEEDTLFPILSSSVAPIFLIDSVGDISIAPLGSALLQIDSENDVSASILETDHDTFVVGSALPQIGFGDVTFLVQPTGVVLDLALDGSTLGSRTGGLVQPIVSGVPDISVSHPTAPPGTAGGRLIIRSVTHDVTRKIVHTFDTNISAFNA